jgi:hypothetical protein
MGPSEAGATGLRPVARRWRHGKAKSGDVHPDPEEWCGLQVARWHVLGRRAILGRPTQKKTARGPVPKPLTQPASEHGSPRSLPCLAGLGLGPFGHLYLGIGVTALALTKHAIAVWHAWLSPSGDETSSHVRQQQPKQWHTRAQCLGLSAAFRHSARSAFPFAVAPAITARNVTEYGRTAGNWVSG